MHTYARPNIITSLINILVFIPMLALHGIVGTFLSNIPITLFATLLASLFLALTVNGALFAKLNKRLDYYYNDDEHDESLALISTEEREILMEERQGKRSIPLAEAPKIEQGIDFVREWYISILRFALHSSFWREMIIFLPIALVLATFAVLSSSI
jgi:multidrug efflux pump subunit AcrB